jgi:hypothetical protein
MNINLPESTLAIALAHYGTQPLAGELARKLLQIKSPLLICDVLDLPIDNLVMCFEALTKYYDDNLQFKKAKEDTLKMVKVIQKELSIEIEKRHKNAGDTN